MKEEVILQEFLSIRLQVHHTHLYTVSLRTYWTYTRARISQTSFNLLYVVLLNVKIRSSETLQNFDVICDGCDIV